MARKRNIGLTPEERRSLDIEIGFLEGLVRRDPGYFDALQLLADDYTRRGRHLEGLKADQTLAGLRPQDPMVKYNLACSYALTGQFELTFCELNLAIDLGFRDFQWLSRDPDLAGFRKHGLYKKLRKRIRALALRTL